MKTFEEIYSDNFIKLFHVARKMSGDADNAADIVQEVFISLFEKLNNGHDILHLNTWLYRATINKCCDCIKRKNLFQPLDSLINSHADMFIPEEQDISSPVQSALLKLKPQERAMVILYSEGLSYKEIAEMSGIKFSSIGKTLSRTLGKIEKELINQHYELY